MYSIFATTLLPVNVAIVRRSHDAFAPGDMDAVVADMDDAIEWQLFLDAAGRIEELAPDV